MGEGHDQPAAALRPVEAMEIEYGGEPVIMLRDPEGLCPEPVVLPLPVFLIASLFDGRRTTRDIQGMLSQAAGGQIIPSEMIEKISADLDNLHLLDNPRADERRRALEAEFDALPSRPAVHAGSAYPEDAPTLIKTFDELFEGLNTGNGKDRPRGLVVPHIDLRIGGRTIAEGISRIDAGRPPKLYVILGVAHRPTKCLFTLTDKDFETPLGAVEVDKQAAHRLRELCGEDNLSGQIAHLQEHSIEFQTVMLKYYHRAAETDFKILPILCGSLHEDMAPPSEAVSKLILPGHVKPTARRPIDRPEMEQFVASLRKIIEEYDGEVCIIASVDLSHIGRKFGEQHGIDDIRAQQVRREDGEMLEQVVALNPEKFFEHFTRDGNSRNVDAVCSVYVLLHALQGAQRAEQIAYEQWHEEETDSMVTYASLAIY